MKTLGVFLIGIAISTAALAVSWPPMEVKGNAGREIRAIFGPPVEVSHTSPCLTVTNVDASTATTVNSTSAAAATTLYVADTTGIIATDKVVVGAGTAREELCTVQAVPSPTPGPKLTCASNLAYTHTDTQADHVDKTNTLGPLTSGYLYIASCRNASGVSKACLCLFGSSTVDPIAYTPFPIFVSEKFKFFASPSGLYMSCYAFEADDVVDVCAVDY